MPHGKNIHSNPSVVKYCDECTPPKQSEGKGYILKTLNIAPIIPKNVLKISKKFNMEKYLLALPAEIFIYSISFSINISAS